MTGKQQPVHLAKDGSTHIDHHTTQDVVLPVKRVPVKLDPCNQATRYTTGR